MAMRVSAGGGGLGLRGPLLGLGGRRAAAGGLLCGLGGGLVGGRAPGGTPLLLLGLLPLRVQREHAVVHTIAQVAGLHLAALFVRAFGRGHVAYLPHRAVVEGHVVVGEVVQAGVRRHEQRCVGGLRRVRVFGQHPLALLVPGGGVGDGGPPCERMARALVGGAHEHGIGVLGRLDPGRLCVRSRGQRAAVGLKRYGPASRGVLVVIRSTACVRVVSAGGRIVCPTRGVGHGVRQCRARQALVSAARQLGHPRRCLRQRLGDALRAHAREGKQQR